MVYYASFDGYRIKEKNITKSISKQTLLYLVSRGETLEGRGVDDRGNEGRNVTRGSSQ